MKFTIRDLFLVTVIVALVLGWWGLDHWRQANRAGLSESRRKNLRVILNVVAPEWSDFNEDDTYGHVPDPSALAPNPPKD